VHVTVPLTAAEKAAVLHAIAQLDGKGPQKDVRRAAEFALGQREGSLDRKTAEIKEICREELARLKEAEESRKRQRPPDADDMVLTHVQTAEERAAESLKRAEREGNVIEIGDDSPKKAGPPAPAPMPVAPPLAPQLAPPPAGRVCTCGLAAVRLTSRTEYNPGRVFYACRHGRDNGCGFFEWEDGNPARMLRDPNSGLNAAAAGAGGGVDMARLQLLSDLHARGQLSDAQYAQAVALEYQLASLR